MPGLELFPTKYPLLPKCNKLAPEVGNTYIKHLRKTGAHQDCAALGASAAWRAPRGKRSHNRALAVKSIISKAEFKGGKV